MLPELIDKSIYIGKNSRLPSFLHYFSSLLLVHFETVFEIPTDDDVSTISTDNNRLKC